MDVSAASANQYYRQVQMIRLDQQYSSRIVEPKETKADGDQGAKSLDSVSLGSGGDAVNYADQSMRVVEERSITNIEMRMEQVRTGDALAAKETLDKAASADERSPEKVSKKILEFALGFFDAYKQQHPEMSESESRTSFYDLIKGGIEQGFDEAKSVMESLNKFEGEVKNKVDQTYELVQQGLTDFLNAKPDQNLSQQIAEFAAAEMQKAA